MKEEYIEGNKEPKMSVKQNIFIAKRIMVDNIYRSAKLEGLSCTFAQTEEIIENVGCSTLKPSEVNDVINLKRAWEYVLSNYEQQVSLATFQDLHSIIGKGMDTLEWNEIGRFRTRLVGISGTKWLPEIPNTEQCHKELMDILSETNILKRCFTIFLWSCRKQLFLDGNKRVSTLVANLEMIKNGYGLLSVPEECLLPFRRLLIDYYESGDYSEIMQFMYDYCYFPDETCRPRKEFRYMENSAVRR